MGSRADASVKAWVRSSLDVFHEHLLNDYFNVWFRCRLMARIDNVASSSAVAVMAVELNDHHIAPPLGQFCFSSSQAPTTDHFDDVIISRS